MPNGFWIDTLLNTTTGNGAQTIVGLMGSLSTADKRTGGFTLLRTIICIDIGHVVHDSGEGSQFIDIGIGVTSKEAFDVPTVPDPNVPADVPMRGWLYLDTVFVEERCHRPPGDGLGVQSAWPGLRLRR